MADKHQDWIESQLGPMLQRLREGTEITCQLVQRAEAQVRLSLQLLGREAPEAWRVEPSEEE